MGEYRDLDEDELTINPRELESTESEPEPPRKPVKLKMIIAEINRQPAILYILHHISKEPLALLPLLEKLKEDGANVSYSTAFRTLKRLVEHKLATQTRVFNRRSPLYTTTKRGKFVLKEVTRLVYKRLNKELHSMPWPTDAFTDACVKRGLNPTIIKNLLKLREKDGKLATQKVWHYINNREQALDLINKANNLTAKGEFEDALNTVNAVLSQYTSYLNQDEVANLKALQAKLANQLQKREQLSSIFRYPYTIRL